MDYPLTVFSNVTTDLSNTDPEFQRDTELDENSADRDPFRQFSAWFRNAEDSGVPVPEAMFMATSNEKGIPSGRLVLLKGFDANGFVFFTNFNSRKGSEIAVNPYVAIAFHWKETERQVRITGKVQPVSSAESDEYFSSRPLESQISAMISPQSSVIPNRKYLDEKFDEMKRNAGELELVRPAHWGGFRIIPDAFEFWQSRPHRLHDRIRYRLSNGNWIIERLAP